MFSTLVRHGRFISCQKPDLITGGRGILLCLRIVFRLLQNSQHTDNVCIDANGLFRNGGAPQTGHFDINSVEIFIFFCSDTILRTVSSLS